MPAFNFNNKIVRFFIYATVLYISWFLLYELVLKPYTLVDAKLIGVIISHAEFILKLFGYTTYRAVEEDNMQLLGVDGAHPVWIGAPCNALSLFAFFSLFILAFPGQARKKVWFIPLGVLIIHTTNIVRVVGLVLISFHKPEYLDFNHSYTFTLLVYGIIFTLWMWWVNAALKNLKKNEPKS